MSLSGSDSSEHSRAGEHFPRSPAVSVSSSSVVSSVRHANEERWGTDSTTGSNSFKEPITLSTSFRSSLHNGHRAPYRETCQTGDHSSCSDDTYGSLPKNSSLEEDSDVVVSLRHSQSLQAESAPLLARQRTGHSQRSMSQPVSLSSSWVNGRFLGPNPSGMPSPSASPCYGSMVSTEEPLSAGDTSRQVSRANSSFLNARPRRRDCPTCAGSGHLEKDNANELVALVPYRDQRLKPSRLKVYLVISILAVVLSAGITTFFLFPRHVATTTCARTVSIQETSDSTMDVDLQLRFNVTNLNFFKLRLVNMSVSIRQVDLSLGTTIIKFQKNNVINGHHTAMLKHKVNGTFRGDQGRHAVSQCNVNASQNFFLTLNIELTTVYLGINTQKIVMVPHFFSCLPNTTFTDKVWAAAPHNEVVYSEPYARTLSTGLAAREVNRNMCKKTHLTPLNRTAPLTALT